MIHAKREWKSKGTYKRENEESNRGDEANLGNRKKKIQKRPEKKDEVIRHSSMASFKLQRRDLGMEGKEGNGKSTG